jgi:hypothetical protein
MTSVPASPDAPPDPLVAIRVPIEEAGDEFAHARRMLASGAARREDRLIYTRGGKDAISATAGWWADHCVRVNEGGTPVFARWKPRQPSGEGPGMPSDEFQVE